MRLPAQKPHEKLQRVVGSTWRKATSGAFVFIYWPLVTRCWLLDFLLNYHRGDILREEI
jgi:hypothetical protein